MSQKPKISSTYLSHSKGKGFKFVSNSDSNYFILRFDKFWERGLPIATSCICMYILFAHSKQLFFFSVKNSVSLHKYWEGIGGHHCEQRLHIQTIRSYIRPVIFTDKILKFMFTVYIISHLGVREYTHKELEIF